MAQSLDAAPRGTDLRVVAHDLISRGVVQSRAELAERLGVSPSTASAVVKDLVAGGRILEEGPGTSTGGRRPTLLRAVTPEGVVAVAELGSSHMRFGFGDLSGSMLVVEEFEIDIARGPEVILAELARQWRRLSESTVRGRVRAAAVAVPGPVSALTGEIVKPARMPGWHGTRPAEILSALVDVPVLVENDARAAALGEYVARGQVPADLIYVKAGTGIGAGLIAGGQIFHGGHGLAGDIAHVRVVGDPAPKCSCGRRGCLETVASGAAIRAGLRRDGMPAATLSELLDPGLAADPDLSVAMRTAGDRLGRALAPLVNFLNPRLVVIGGGLAGVDAFVAATRSALYEHCLPMCSQDLVIEVAMAGPDAAARGLVHLGRPFGLPAPNQRTSAGRTDA